MTRFYRKISPAVRLQLSNGMNLQFENADGHWGILKVGNETIQAELAACIKSEIGGVSEIGEAEYNEMLEKKTTSRPLWREEFGKNGTNLRPNPIVPPSEAISVVVNPELRFPDGHLVGTERAPIVPQQTPAYRPNATPRS